MGCPGIPGIPVCPGYTRDTRGTHPWGWYLEERVSNPDTRGARGARGTRGTRGTQVPVQMGIENHAPGATVARSRVFVGKIWVCSIFLSDQKILKYAAALLTGSSDDSGSGASAPLRGHR